ncbi:FKBP-type peptidyl-prolyl cis-trans isomerase [Sulfuricystis multivorans]|uniref:FKBP-type peptidyl-prolyl cis-trans isomerase n=1 Tax=Sulfuricystis multivorans TaxID=2211108 RepID=UPI000F84B986|nr:peptidylprolyl isomerase [Sulfuricystis multivorans]
MKIAPNTVVTLAYRVTDPDGELIDPGERPIVYLHGGYDDIFPRIEQALQGKETGDSVQVKLQPAEAFGEYDADLVQIEPRSSFPEILEVGMQFEGALPGADEDDFIVYRVTQILDDKVMLDGNHPLAGTALVFSCTVSDVRPATAEEIAHGHVHGDGGHSH